MRFKILLEEKKKCQFKKGRDRRVRKRKRRRGLELEVGVSLEFGRYKSVLSKHAPSKAVSG
jgi:hypothetical protein